MSKLNIQTPGATWCAYHQAQFRFFPEPAVSPGQVRAGLLQRCARVIDQYSLSVGTKEEYDWAVSCFSENWKLLIDAETAEFELTNFDGDDGSFDFAPFGRPTKFIRDLEEKRPSALSAGAYDVVKALAHGLSMLGRSQFERALRRGWAQIMARPNSLLADFSHIPLDAWSAFSVHLREEHGDPASYIFDATGPKQTKLFSIFVAPAFRAQKQAAKSTSSAERECNRWLVQMMQVSPNAPTSTRKALEADAIKKFAGLSGLSFDRAWREAIDATGAKWSSPGRRPKNLKSKTPQR